MDKRLSGAMHDVILPPRDQNWYSSFPVTLTSHSNHPIHDHTLNTYESSYKYVVDHIKMMGRSKRRRRGMSKTQARNWESVLKGPSNSGFGSLKPQSSDRGP